MRSGVTRAEMDLVRRLTAAEDRKKEKAKELAKKWKVLTDHGFVIGPRDYRLNTNFFGSFMVAEPYGEDELPTEDGSNGPWCIVGDNIESLVEEAYKCGIWDR